MAPVGDAIKKFSVLWWFNCAELEPPLPARANSICDFSRWERCEHGLCPVRVPTASCWRLRVNGNMPLAPRTAAATGQGLSDGRGRWRRRGWWRFDAMSRVKRSWTNGEAAVGPAANRRQHRRGSYGVRPSPSPGGGVGMVNLGNTCFLNSVVQVCGARTGGPRANEFLDSAPPRADV